VVFDFAQMRVSLKPPIKSHPGTHRVSNRCTNIDAHIGSRIRAQRQIQRMSQGQLASLLGLTFQQVQKYEKGVNQVAAGRLYHIAKILNLPVSYFFDGLASETNNTGAASEEADQVGNTFALAEEFIRSAEGIQLIKFFKTIKGPQTRRRIIALMKAVACETSGASGE
jgi:transcriptional regulator with XRE-family HTH domain